MGRVRDLAVRSWDNLGLLIGALVVWELGVRLFGIPEYVLPPASVVLSTIIKNFAYLARHSLATLAEVLAGFAISVVVGVLIALAMTYSPWFKRAFMPLLIVAQTVPKVAIAPIFLIWFGFGVTPKILIVFLISFFPIAVNTSLGFASMEEELEMLARSMGAQAWRMFLRFRMPTALPHFFSGLKVAISLAIVGAVVGEFVGASKGVGYVLLAANGNMDTKLAFAAVVLLSLMGTVLYLLVAGVEKWAIPWHTSQRRESQVMISA